MFLALNGVMLLAPSGCASGSRSTRGRGPTSARAAEPPQGGRRRHGAGDRSDPRLLAVRRDDERRAAGRAEQRGRRRFSFLLATPIIGAAALLRCRSCWGRTATASAGPRSWAVCAAATTYVAVKFLLRFFETNRLTPFGIYCLVAGVGLSAAFALGL